MKLRIGVDLGGTKIEAIALDATGDVAARERRATPQGDYAGTLSTIADLVTGIEDALGTTGSVGVGTPGTLVPETGLLRNSNSLCLIGQPIRRDLERLLDRDIRLANDADCFALSEATDGAGARARTVFGVILGTGAGSGIVVDGRLLAGPHGIAGEWGHNALPWPTPAELPGPKCYCGLHGCIETWVSGPGLAADHERTCGIKLTAQAIAAAAQAGDADADATLTRYEDRLARALAGVINLIDPDVIVLGGGLSNVERLYARVPTLWARHAFTDVVKTRLVPPRHGDSSGTRGAAWLWSD